MPWHLGELEAGRRRPQPSLDGAGEVGLAVAGIAGQNDRRARFRPVQEQFLQLRGQVQALELAVAQPLSDGVGSGMRQASSEVDLVTVRPIGRVIMAGRGVSSRRS